MAGGALTIILLAVLLAILVHPYFLFLLLLLGLPAYRHWRD